MLSARGAFAPDAVYTIQDIKGLEDYAARRGVRVVAEFDLPAHTSSWGDGYPELVVACPGKSKKPAVYE